MRVAGDDILRGWLLLSHHSVHRCPPSAVPRHSADIPGRGADVMTPCCTTGLVLTEWIHL